MNYGALTAQELREEHNQLLRIQEQEVEAGHRRVALNIAEERQALWETARERGVDLL